MSRNMTDEERLARVVPMLIELGSRPDIDSPEVVRDFEALRREDLVNRLYHTKWTKAASELGRRELEHLIRGLTIAELRFGWMGGSVAGVIWVYRYFQKAGYDMDKRVYMWVASRSANPWAPGGGIPPEMVRVFDAHSPQWRARWYERYSEARRRSRAFLLEEKRKRVATAEREAEANRSRNAEERRRREAYTARRKEERARLVLEGEGLDAIGRLKLMVANPTMPLEAFPPGWAVIPDTLLARLDGRERSAALERLGRMRNGPWRELHDRLGRVLPE